MRSVWVQRGRKFLAMALSLALVLGSSDMGYAAEVLAQPDEANVSAAAVQDAPVKVDSDGDALPSEVIKLDEETPDVLSDAALGEGVLVLGNEDEGQDVQDAQDNDEDVSGLPQAETLDAGAADSNADDAAAMDRGGLSLAEEGITATEPEENVLAGADDEADLDSLLGAMASTVNTYAGSTFATAYTGHQNDFFNYRYADHLNQGDTDDYFKFTLAHAGTVTFRVTSPQGPSKGGTGIGVKVGIYVYDSDAGTNSHVGSGGASTTNIGAVSGSISVHLPRGTYWVRTSINQNGAPSSGGDYILTPSFTSANVSFEEAPTGTNNSVATASGPLSFGKLYRGQLTVHDNEDYYRFVVSEPGRVTFAYDWNSEPNDAAGISSRLYDGWTGSAKENVHNSIYGNLWYGQQQQTNTTYYADLSAGTYYLCVNHLYMEKGGNYRFMLTFSKAAVSIAESSMYGNNNSIATASAISFDKVYSGLLSATDRFDYYKISVGNNCNISLEASVLKGPMGGTSFAISDEYGAFDEGYKLNGGGTWTVTVPYSNETYYLRFYNDTGNYRFRLYNGVIKEFKYNKGDIANVGYKYYTGKAIKPKPKVTCDGKTLSAKTDYTVSYKNNKKPGTATIIVKGKNGYSGTMKQTFKIIKPSVKYTTSVQGKGYKQGWKKDGAISGFPGKGKYVQYFKANLTGVRPTGAITYRVNTVYAGKGQGWSTDWRQGWMSYGSEAGNDKNRIETIEIKLIDEMNSYYNVYYRVYAKGYGWMGWAKNGKPAGTEHMNRRIEAIQVTLVKKKAKAPAAKFKGAKRKTKAAYKRK